MHLYTTLWNMNVRKKLKPNDNNKHLSKWKTFQTNIAVNDPYDTRLS